MIEIKNVTKVYENSNQKVLENLSFRVERGGFLFLTGASGSGKSTVINLIIKESEPTTGQIWVNSHCITGMDKHKIPEYRRTIGVVFQDFRLIHDLNIYQNIEIAQIVTGSRGRDRARRITAILSLLRIADKYRAYPKELSGGEQAKACLARAMINQPSILLADEPTGNLDRDSAEEIMQILQMLHRNKTTVIVATHDKAWIEKMGQPCIVLTDKTSAGRAWNE